MPSSGTTTAGADWHGDWLLKLIYQLVDAEYDHCRERVAQLRNRCPGLSDDELAREIVGDASFWAAVVGAGVGAIHSVPALGQAIALGAVLPEVAYLTKLQATTAIQIALVYRYDLSREQVVLLTLSCLAYSYALDAIKAVVKNAAVTWTRQTLERVIAESMVAVARSTALALGTNTVAHGLLECVPLVAVPVGAIMNYSGLQAFGLVSMKFFSPNFTPCATCGVVVPRRARFCSKCGSSAAA